MQTNYNKPTFISPDQGDILSVVGDTYRILINGEQTQGTYAAIDMQIPPNGGPGPHSHTKIQEAFYVLDGEIEVQSEAGNFIAKKGAYVNIPLDGPVHCFKNTSQSIAHLLCIVTPSGLESFFKEIGKPVEAGKFLPPPQMTPEEVGKLKASAEKYGQKLYPPDYFDKK